MLNSWICSESYKLKNNHFISFIRDLKKNNNYVLKGSISFIWNTLVSEKSIDSVYDICKKKNLEKQLYEFLAELKEKEIIKLDTTFNTVQSNHLSLCIKGNDPNFDYYTEKKENLLKLNDYIGRLYFELNNECNLNCIHCCNDKEFKNKRITFDQAKKIIDEAMILGLSSVALTGGECTINPDFLRIARYVRSKHIQLDILTNAQKLYDDREMLDELVNIYPMMFISLYSMNPEVHDGVTNKKGSYKKTLSVIKYLREKNIPVFINCMIIQNNYNDYKEVEKFAESIGATFLPNTKFIDNQNNNNSHLKLTKEQLEKYYLAKVASAAKEEKCTSRNCPICNACYNRLSITPELNITPCLYFNYNLGNYNDTSLKEMKLSSIPEFRSKFIRKHFEDCYKHEYCKFCVFCPVYSLYEKKTYYAKSESLCENAKAKYKAYLYQQETINKDK